MVIIFFLLIVFVVDLMLAWLLQLVLMAFGVALSIWICFAIVFLLGWLFKRK